MDAVLQKMESEKESQLESLSGVAVVLRDVDKLTRKLVREHKQVHTDSTQTDSAVFDEIRRKAEAEAALKREVDRRRAVANIPQPPRLPLRSVPRFYFDYSEPPLFVKYFHRARISKRAPGAVSGLSLAGASKGSSRAERSIPLPKLLDLFSAATDLKIQEDSKSDRQGLPRIPFWRALAIHINRFLGSGSKAMGKRHLGTALLTTHRFRSTCRMPQFRRRLQYLGMDRPCVCNESLRAYGVCACGSSMQSPEFMVTLEQGLRLSLLQSADKYRDVLGLD